MAPSRHIDHSQHRVQHPAALGVGWKHGTEALAEADTEAGALAVRAEAHRVAVLQKCAGQPRRELHCTRAVARGFQQACRAARRLQGARGFGLKSCAGLF